MSKKLVLFVALAANASACHAYQWTVDSVGDNNTSGNGVNDVHAPGQCTLRKVIQNINAHHVAGDGKPNFHIDCPPAGANPAVDEVIFKVNTVSLLYGQLSLLGNREVLMNTKGSAIVTIFGTGSDRILQIAGGQTNADITIHRMHFTNGRTKGAGGAILQESDTSKLTLRECLFEDNVAETEGGAIKSKGHLVAVRVAFRKNRAEPTLANFIGSGGAIWSSGTLELTGIGSQITENRANLGGGIYLQGGKATVVSYDLINNLSSRFPVQQAAPTPNAGGAAIYNFGASLHLIASKVRQNKSRNAHGGGIYNASAGTANVSLTNFRSNYSYCVNPLKDEECGGGGIFNRGELLVQRSSFSFGISSGPGGGIAALQTGSKATRVGNSTFAANFASQSHVSSFPNGEVIGPLVNGVLYSGSAVWIKGIAVAELVNNTFVKNIGISDLALLPDPASGKPTAKIVNNVFHITDEGATVACEFDKTSVPAFLTFDANIESPTDNPDDPSTATCPNATDLDPMFFASTPGPGFSAVEYYDASALVGFPANPQGCSDVPTAGVDVLGKPRGTAGKICAPGAHEVN